MTLLPSGELHLPTGNEQPPGDRYAEDASAAKNQGPRYRAKLARSNFPCGNNTFLRQRITLWALPEERPEPGQERALVLEPERMACSGVQSQLSTFDQPGQLLVVADGI